MIGGRQALVSSLGSLLVLAGAAGGAMAEPVPEPGVSAGGPPPVESQLQQYWFARRAALQRNDMVQAAASVDSMRILIQSEHLDRVPWLARAFAFEGYERLQEGNYERAREAFDIARRFDSRMPEAQTGYAWAALRAGRGLPTFIKEYRHSLWLRWDAFVRDGRANALLTALAACWLLSLTAILVIVIRYGAMLRHDVAERMPARWADGAARVAGWVVLFGPLVLWMGGSWILLYWCVLMARYMSSSERVVAGLACLVIVATGPVAAQSAQEARQAADPTVLAVGEALDGGYGKDVIRVLQRVLEDDPGSLPLRLLLANTYHRANLNREAFEEYQRILKVSPQEPRTLNNVGSLYYKTGQAAQSAVYFGRAVEVETEEPIIYYNLTLAQSATLRLADAESSLRRLQQLDPNLARAVVDARGRGEEPDPLALWVSREEVWNYLEQQLASRDRAPLMAHLSTPNAIAAMVSLILLGWSGILGRSSSRAQICIRCGDPFCGRCKKEIGAKECCAQCIHLFVKKEAIAPDVRAKKERQVEKFTRRAGLKIRVASLVLPGAGHMLAGKTMLGLLLAGLWLLPLTVLLLRGRLILPPSSPVLDLPGLSVLLAASLMVLMWLGANLFVPKAAV
jgi:Tfp pilus assembly protein PilF